MSSDKRNISVNDYEMNIDLYSILRDIWTSDPAFGSIYELAFLCLCRTKLSQTV